MKRVILLLWFGFGRLDNRQFQGILNMKIQGLFSPLTKQKANTHRSSLSGKTLWALLLLSATINLLFLSPISRLMASPIEVKLSGVYYDELNLFEGSIEYPVKIESTRPILFHLPPNWYGSEDRRHSYTMRDEAGTIQEIPREDLTVLAKYHHQNIHLPHGIRIKSVLLNDMPVFYALLENPRLMPGMNIEKALLSINPPEAMEGSIAKIQIDFETVFNELPKGYKRILWDFIPRKIVELVSGADFRGSVCEKRRMTGAVDVISPSGKKRLIIDEWQLRATVLIDEWDLETEKVRYSSDDFVWEQSETIVDQISTTREYLVENGWIRNRPMNIVIWDGGIASSGRYLFLPRRVFAYNDLFFKKLYSITFIKAVISGGINNSLRLDALAYPWIIPAIQAEVIQSYIDGVMKGQTRLFPMGDWMNPDFRYVNTVNQWITENNTKRILGASSPIELSYYDSVYHPWYEKGYHLLWILHGGDSEKEERYQDLIKQMLVADYDSERRICSAMDFFTWFEDSERVGEIWLSSVGRVDYGLERVSFDNHQPESVTLTIENDGTISPPLEIVFIFDDSSQKREILNHPEGVHSFHLTQRPRQILLDPDIRLLEDNIVNNSWNIPVKIRPIFDLTAADRWVVSFLPMIGGSAFDKNTFGVTAMASYLEETFANISLVKSALSPYPLIQGKIMHTGFPFKGTTIELSSGQLNAANTVSVGFEHQPYQDERRGLLEVNLLSEHLHAMQIGGYSSLPSDWWSAELAAEYPLYHSAFFEWRLESNLAWGESSDTANRSYNKVELLNLLSYEFPGFELQAGLLYGMSEGSVPTQKKFPLGGVEGLHGYPRDSGLLFDYYQIWEVGIGLPELVNYTGPMLDRGTWGHYIKPTLLIHWGFATQGIIYQRREFMDMELAMEMSADLLNNIDFEIELSLAFPINDPDYKNPRLVLASIWSF